MDLSFSFAPYSEEKKNCKTVFKDKQKGKERYEKPRECPGLNQDLLIIQQEFWRRISFLLFFFCDVPFRSRFSRYNDAVYFVRREFLFHPFYSLPSLECPCDISKQTETYNAGVVRDPEHFQNAYGNPQHVRLC